MHLNITKIGNDESKSEILWAGTVAKEGAWSPRKGDTISLLRDDPNNPEIYEVIHINWMLFTEMNRKGISLTVRPCTTKRIDELAGILGPPMEVRRQS